MNSTDRLRIVYRRQIKGFFLLYFLQGLPYGFQTRFLPIFLRHKGMSLTNVGLFKILLFPWVLKSFWAPLVDKYGEHKSWLSGCLFIMVVLCIISAHFVPQSVAALVIALFFFNLTTAVQDIALDALVMDSFPPSQLVLANTIQTVGNRAGTMCSGGLFSWLTVSISWESIFYIMSLMYAFGFVVCERYIPYRPPRPSVRFVVETPARLSARPSREDTSPTSQPPTSEHVCTFNDILNVQGTIWMFIFVSVYKTGEYGIICMYPLFLLDHGVEPGTVGLWTGLAAQSFSLIGSMFGAFISTRSVWKSLKAQLLFRLLASVSICVCVVLWRYGGNTEILYVVSMISLMVILFLSGIITTCTLTLIMLLSKSAQRSCRVRHYTLLVTGEMAGKLLTSAVASVLAHYTGYSFVFGLLAICSGIPFWLIMNTPQSLDALVGE